MTQQADLKPEELVILPCPFCGEELYGPVSSRTPDRLHPANDCYLSGLRLVENCFAAWNTRALSLPPDGWRTMESAPKDGSKFLAIGGVFHGMPFVLRWYPRDQSDAMPWYAPQSASRLYEHVPTHWMPLPPPPQEGV